MMLSSSSASPQSEIIGLDDEAIDIESEGEWLTMEAPNFTDNRLTLTEKAIGRRLKSQSREEVEVLVVRVKCLRLSIDAHTRSKELIEARHVISIKHESTSASNAIIKLAK